MYIDANLTVPAQFIQSISREMVRGHFEALSRNFNDFAFDADARIDELRKSLSDFKVELQNSDFSRPQRVAHDVAKKLGMPNNRALTAGENRQFAMVLKAILTTELKSLEDFEDPLLAARSLFDRYEISLRDGQVPPYITVSSAVEHTQTNRTEEMKRKFGATRSLLVEFFGDVSLEYVAQNFEKFLLFLHSLPRDHGQKHGKNRYNSECKAPSKQDLIDAANTHDKECYAAVRSFGNLSTQQQLAELPEMLTIRMAHANLERHLDRIHDVLRHAAAHLGYSGPTKLMGYSELRRRMKAYEQELAKEEPLYVRVTRPKRRTRWSNQRLKALLTSPVYRGCKSRNRRSHPGKCMIRDAIYWVPLIVLFMGTRLTEVLQLKARDLIFHSDGVFCLRLAWSAEQAGKTEASRREVPIPQALIDLGFIEWIQTKAHDPNNLLFPEIYKKDPKHPDQTFTKRFQTIRKNLNILSHTEDFYALRMSLSSALWRGGVSEADRQIVIGHASTTTIGKHYTDPDMKVLKSLMDRANFGLKIYKSRVHKCPLIGDCELVSGRPARIELALNSDAAIGAIRVVDETTNSEIFACIMEGKNSAFDSGWVGAKSLPKAQAAKAVHDLTSEFAFNKLGNSAESDAFDHFMAFGVSPAEVK